MKNLHSDILRGLFRKNNDRKMTFSRELNGANTVLLQGFKSTLKSFTIVFEDHHKQQVRYLLGDTSLGYFNDNVAQFEKVWFEYDKSEEELEINLHIF